MKFITESPFNNTFTSLKYGYQKEYNKFPPEHTVNLLYLKTNKAPKDQGTKELVCPFCGKVLTVKMHTSRGSYEDRTDDSYHFDPEVEHVCDTLVELEKQIAEAQKIQKEIDDIKTTKIMPRETNLTKINKGIKQLAITETTVIVSNGQIFKKN